MAAGTDARTDASPHAPRTRRLLATGATSAGVAVGGLALLALPASADTDVPRPSSFTSTFSVQATADQVVGDTSGDTTASGAFVLELNSALDVVCYTVTTRGVEPPYMSPARTSTHIHEAAAGSSGPPRLVFADPMPLDSDPRVSSACVQGPFDTGVTSDAGGDTGAGFTVAELEADPSAYYVDIHTSLFPGGSLRGQLPAAAGAGTPAAAPAATPSATPSAAPSAAPTATPAPVAPQQAPPAQAPAGGVAAGFGGLSDDGGVPPVTASLAAALVALAAGLTGGTVLRGRRRA